MIRSLTRWGGCLLLVGVAGGCGSQDGRAVSTERAALFDSGDDNGTRLEGDATAAGQCTDGVLGVVLSGTLRTTGAVDSAEVWVWVDDGVGVRAQVIAPQSFEHDGQVKSASFGIPMSVGPGKHEVALCFVQSGAEGREAKKTCATAWVQGCDPPPVPPVPPVEDPPPSDAYGLTWGYYDGSNAAWPAGEIFMSCHGTPHGVDTPWRDSCNPYSGDTQCSRVRPILCVRKDGSAPLPSSYSYGFYNGWVGGVLASSQPVAGTELTSPAAADAICARDLGPGFVMAEHHDGGGGWGFLGLDDGRVNTSIRNWLRINDQPGNCWN